MTCRVYDYDRTIDFCARALRFMLIEDIPEGPDKRWVRAVLVGGVTESRYHLPS
jgi:hypothetical protein